MPIVAASNGVRPEIRALGVIHLNKPVTPAEINAHVGTGDYAAKYISFLRNRYGFTFQVNKDGRQVLSYTCIAEPANVAELRATQPKAKAAKAAKTAKPSKPVAVKVKTKIVKPKSEETGDFQIKVEKATKADAEASRKPVSAAAIAIANMSKNRAKVAARKSVKPKKVDHVEKTLGSSGEIATSYNIDGDFDSVEGMDIKSLVI